MTSKDTYAGAEDFVAEHPDIVIVTTWDVLGGQVAPAAQVLLFDDNGGHPGFACAEFIAGSGAQLELVTPERVLGPEVGGMNYPAYFRTFDERGVTFTLNQRLTGVRREGNRLVATLYNEYRERTTERTVDQVVVEHGTLPADETYLQLQAGSTNDGEIDVQSLLAGRPQSTVYNPDGRYRLFRVGDAVTSRNVHAAIQDSPRLCKDL